MSERIKWTIMYFDDDSEDRNTYSRQLQHGDELEVIGLAPPAGCDLSVLPTLAPDVFLVDYELTKAQPGGQHVNYLGGTLTSALRERFPEYPVVLLTRRALRSWEDARQLLESLQIFDGVLYKGDIDEDPDSGVIRLVSIGKGFKQLREARHDWRALVSLLGATEAEEQQLREAAAPLVRGRWQVAQAARWIENVLLKYPGILYDDVFTATALGISADSFRHPQVHAYFADCKYVGVLQPADDRWWRKRVLGKASRLLAECNLSGPVHDGFARAVEETMGVRLSPAVCIFSGEHPANWVCHVLREPVMFKYTLRYHPDTRPMVMDDARVSFKAIRESNDVDDDLFEADAEALIREIRKREVRPCDA